MLRRLAVLPVLLLASPATLSAATFTYDGGGASPNLWSQATNWVGDTLPTFDNQADLVFDSNIGTLGMRIGVARTARSLFFGDSLSVPPNTLIAVQTEDDAGAGTPALTLQADVGNATVTQSSGFVPEFLRLGSTGRGNVILGSNLDLYANSATKPVLFDSIVSGAGALNKYGVGRAQLYRANTFSGGVNVLEGTLEAYNNAAAMGTGAVSVGGVASSTNANISFGNTFTFTNAITVNSGSGMRTIANMISSNAAGNPSLSGGITLNKDATFAITQVTASTHDRIILAGVASGAGGIVKSGSGVMVLTVSNTYNGATDIQGGKLALSGAGRLGSGAVTISNGANIDFSTGAGQTNIVSNNISGEGLILQNNAGTDTRIAGNVTSTGGLTLNAGAFRIGNGGATGSYSGNALINGGASLAFNRSNAYTHSGTISGGGAVSKVLAGVVTLTGSNSYSGLTTLFDGVLVADNANALGTGNITFSSAGGNTGTIRYTTNSAGTDWGARFKNSTGTIRLDTASNNVTLAGVIDNSNTNGLTKSGAGTLTLAGTNSYRGNTTVSAGVLEVAPTGALTFVIGGSGTNNQINGGGAAVLNGRFVLDLSAASTNTNATWTIVQAAIAETYGTNFIVSGFNGAGGLWTNTTNGVSYVFAQSNSVLSVQPASTPAPYDAWTAYWQGVSPGFTNTAGTDNPDGDPFDNNEEFAFDGNPTIGTGALLSATKAGTNVVFNFVALTNTNAATYQVQSTTSLSSGPWTNASVTISNSTNQSGINLTNSYARREFVVPAASNRFFRVEATFTNN